MGRISRPLLDRMDICVEAPPVRYEELGGEWKNESSAQIRERVCAARERQKKRFKGRKIFFNSQMKKREVELFCPLEPEAAILLEEVFRRMKLSARAYHRILKVARTIADLEGKEKMALLQK